MEERFAVDRVMGNEVGDTKVMEAVKLSEMANRYTDVVYKDMSFVDTMKALLKYKVAFQSL